MAFICVGHSFLTINHQSTMRGITGSSPSVFGSGPFLACSNWRILGSRMSELCTLSLRLIQLLSCSVTVAVQYSALAAYQQSATAQL